MSLEDHPTVRQTEATNAAFTPPIIASGPQTWARWAIIRRDRGEERRVEVALSLGNMRLMPGEARRGCRTHAGAGRAHRA